MMSIFSRLPNALRCLIPSRWRDQVPRVSVIRLSGTIGPALPFRGGLSLSIVAPMLERAFALADARAVAIVINSPGGSPAQSHLIFTRIRALAQEKGLPVLVFVEDAAASGGYMIACAGDEIFADPSSIIGSIGVVSAGFGFDRFIERYGIERRIHTAGQSKSMLDPFRPENPDDVIRLRKLQTTIHEVFIAIVSARRGTKLDTENEELFSGAFWVGEEALHLGLVDGIGDIRSVLRARFGDKVDLHLIAPPRTSLIARLSGRQGFSSSSLFDPAETLAALEERSAWARLGL